MKPMRLKVQPDLFIQFGYLWMGILAIYWLCLFLTPARQNNDIDIEVLIVTIGLSLAVAGWLWGRALADGARVLGALPVPRLLWRRWLRNTLSSACFRWGAATLAATLALALKGTVWGWSCVAVLYSAILTLSVIASLSHHGVWHWAWLWCIALGVSILAAYTGQHGLGLLQHGPVMWYLPIALSWPVLAVSLAWYWRMQPPQEVAVRKRLQFDFPHRCVSYIARYRLLNPTSQRGMRPQGWRGISIFSAFFPILYTFSWHVQISVGYWGKQASAMYIGTLAVLPLAASGMVVCKDLHWRRVLAPNGFPRGSLGSHLILSTLIAGVAMMAAIATAIGVILVFCSWAGFGYSFAHYMEIAGRYRVLPLEYVLAICLGVALRATSRPFFYCFAFFCLLICAGLLLHFTSGTAVFRDFFAIGPAYAACLVLATGAAIALANRLWTAQKLLPYIVIGNSSSENSVAGGRLFTWLGRPY